MTKSPEMDDAAGRPTDEAFASDATAAAGAGDDELGRLRGQLAEEQDRCLRLRAEMENLRSRTSRELGEQARYASFGLAQDIIPAIDDFDRALESATSEDASGVLAGVKMVRSQLLSVLEKHNCIPVVPQGEPFDPRFHEAILQQPSADCPAQHVLQVVKTGYRMHDRVVRAAQVIVSSGPQA
ncbi:MAG: nucleotide exchange factor GrpE [Planctomycetales bacterium]|nr:nucleotide exchange factor GrpE [Planctomycetales bacterium]